MTTLITSLSPSDSTKEVNLCTTCSPPCGVVLIATVASAALGLVTGFVYNVLTHDFYKHYDNCILGNHSVHYCQMHSDDAVRSNVRFSDITHALTDPAIGMTIGLVTGCVSSVAGLATYKVVSWIKQQHPPKYSELQNAP